MNSRRLVLTTWVLTGCFDPESEGSEDDTDAGSTSSSTSPSMTTATPTTSASTTETESGPPETTSSDASTTDPVTGPSSSSSGPDEPVCGNDMVESGEDCDDGNMADGDGCNADCTPSGQEQWTRTYNGAANLDDVARAVAILDDGSVAVAGSVSTLANSQDAWVRLYSVDGDPEWTDAPFATAGNDVAQDITATADGYIVVCGFFPGDHIDTFASRYSAAGEVEWTTTYAGGVALGEERCRSVRTSATGEIYVTGEASIGAANNPDAWLGRLDPDDGIIDVTGAFSGTPVPSNDSVTDINFADDGRLVAVGWSSSGALPRDALATMWDGDLAAPAWSWTFDGPEGAEDEAQAILTQGDSIWVFGFAAVAGQTRAFEAVLDVDGVELDVGLNPDLGITSINGAEFDGAGNMILVGVHDASGSADAWVQKRSPDGREVWSEVYDGSLHEGDGIAEVAVGPSDEVVVVGHETVDGQGTDIWVRKYSP